MNKVLRAAIRTMSRHQGDMTKDYEKNRKKEKMYPYYKGRSCNTMDRILHLEGRDILLRTYSYDGKVAPLILFFHGGGFVTGDFESYGNVCANLSERTGYKVVSVNYRLAPEHRFPQGLEDCYETLKIRRRCLRFRRIPLNFARFASAFRLFPQHLRRR